MRTPRHSSPGRLARWRPDSFTLLLAGLSLLGAALILAREASYGVALEADFAAYLSVARNLLAGEGFVQIYGWPYLHWPPLYPLLLVAASLGVFDPLQVAGPLNAAVFGLTIFVAGHYLRRRVQHPFLVIWAGLAIMLATPLTWVASAAISEAPFILFTTLALTRTARFLEVGKDSNRADLIWAAVFTALALLTRYVGVTLIITVLPLLLLRRGVAPGDKAKDAGLYLLIAVTPVALWLAHNLLVHGQIHGITWPSPYSLPEILEKYLSDLAKWVFLILPAGDIRVAAALLTGLVLVVLALAVGYTLIRSHQATGEEQERGAPPFYLFGGFALVYLAFLTVSQTQTEFVPLGGRHLTPVYIPLLFAAVLTLDKLLAHGPGGWAAKFAGRWPAIGRIIRPAWPPGAKPGLLALVIVAALFLWLAGGVALNAREIRQANEQGLGFRGQEFANSEVLQYVRGIPADRRIFSNGGDVIYIYANHPGYYYLVRELDDARHPSDAGGARRQIEEAAAGAYVAWFHFQARYYDYAVEELPYLEPVAELADGSIFRVNRAYAPPGGSPPGG